MLSIRKSILALLGLLILGSGAAYAASVPAIVTLNKSVNVIYNEEMQRLKNVKSEIVYPIHYEETIYLPIRSISSMLNVGISWDGETNSICLGGEEMDEISAETITEFVAESNEEITAYLNEDIKIYQNEELYIFEEIDGKVSYPLSYNGTTYLSVSEISNLFNVSVTNDAEESKIIIVKEENNTFSGKYISNVDGYTEVILTPNEEGFNFYLRGYKLGAGFAGKGNASVSGDVGTYELDNFETEEKDKIEFRMVDSKLVITVTNEEHNSFVGEYLLDDGKENAVVLSNPNAISGIYEGEKAKLELVEIEDGLLDAAFTGSYGEDGFFFTGAVLNYENGIATFEEEVFDYVNKLTITVNDETIEVEAYSTEEDSVYQYLSGTYEFTEKKVWDFEECKKHAEEIFVEDDCFIY